MTAKFQLITRQVHGGQGGPQKPACRLQNPAATREKNIDKLRSDDQSIIGRCRQFPKDLFLMWCGNAPANTPAIFVRATFLQKRERLDSRNSAKVLQQCREHRPSLGRERMACDAGSTGVFVDENPHPQSTSPPLAA